MKLDKLRVNHLKNPLGYNFDTATLSWTVTHSTGKKQTGAQVQVSVCEDFGKILLDSGRRRDISSLAYPLPLTLSSCTRYYWRVTVWADDGDTGCADAWFETAKQDTAWRAQWITPDFPGDIHPVLRRQFMVAKAVKAARCYVCGLGLYEMAINGAKTGDEVLAPHYNSYCHWLQYQTYDVTSLINAGENYIELMLGNGWYKGRFGFGDKTENLYGDRFILLCELVVTLEDGSTLVVGSDESWQCAPSQVQESSIYDGEIFDARRVPRLSDWRPALMAVPPSSRLVPRLSPPVRVIETLSAAMMMAMCLF